MITEIVNKVGKRNFWFTSTIFLTLTLFHLLTSQEIIAIHIFIRSIYFVPIVLIALWKGKKGGLISSLIASVLISPHFFFDLSSNEFILENSISIILFNLTGLAVGFYSDRQKRSYFVERTHISNPTTFGKNILIYLDDTPLSLKVVHWAVQFLNLHRDIQITILFVLLNRTEPTSSAKSPGEQDIEKALDHLKDAKNSLVENGIPEDKIEMKHVAAVATSPRPSSDKILEELEKKNYDAILVPKHYKTRAQEFILGDVAVRLMRDASVPVLAIKDYPN
jgi:nucleotide-binding universal stress UspA family protein